MVKWKCPAEISCQQKHVIPSYARWIRTVLQEWSAESNVVYIRSNVKVIRSKPILHVSKHKEE